MSCVKYRISDSSFSQRWELGGGLTCLLLLPEAEMFKDLPDYLGLKFGDEADDLSFPDIF